MPAAAGWVFCLDRIRSQDIKCVAGAGHIYDRHL